MFQKNLPEKVKFQLTPGEWEQLTPVRSKSGRLKLPTGWTEIFLKHMKQSNPYCCFSFTGNRVRALGSRKRTTPYFRGKAVCRHSDCLVQARLTVTTNDEASRTVTLTYTDNVNHDTSYITARQVKGKVRQEIAEKLSNVCPSKYHHDRLNAIPSGAYAAGNRDASTTNVGVLRKIKSEVTSASSEHRNVILSILHQKSKMEKESILASKVSGYIQRFCPSPLQVFLWSETSVRLYNDFAIETKIFFDATGLKVKKLALSANSGRILYYSLVLQHPKRAD